MWMFFTYWKHILSVFTTSQASLASCSWIFCLEKILGSKFIWGPFVVYFDVFHPPKQLQFKRSCSVTLDFHVFLFRAWIWCSETNWQWSLNGRMDKIVDASWTKMPSLILTLIFRFIFFWHLCFVYFFFCRREKVIFFGLTTILSNSMAWTGVTVDVFLIYEKSRTLKQELLHIHELYILFFVTVMNMSPSEISIYISIVFKKVMWACRSFTQT